MGSWMSHYWWGGDPDTINPISGLTIREIYYVQKTWMLLYADPASMGMETFARLFRTYSETKEFFKTIKKLSEEDLRKSDQFKAHVINLMSSLNLAVVYLSRPVIVAAIMNDLGKSHGRRKIQEIHFNELKDIIVEILVEELNLDEKTLKAWNKTISFFYKHIFETLTEKTQDN